MRYRELEFELKQACKNNALIQGPVQTTKNNFLKKQKGLISIYCEKTKTIHELYTYPTLTA